MAHAGTAAVIERQLVGTNSCIKEQKVVRYIPHPNPIRNLQAANISQETEKAAIRLQTVRTRRDRKKAGFRPRESAICPATGELTRRPAICMVVMVEEIQSLSQINSNCKQKKTQMWHNFAMTLKYETEFLFNHLKGELMIYLCNSVTFS